MSLLNMKPDADSNLWIVKDESAPISSWGVRDLVATGFHHKGALAVLFCGIVLLGLLAALFLPRQYQSEAKILVDHERLDPVVTPAATPISETRPSITKEEMNSEVELMGSEDLLQKIVEKCGLAGAPASNPSDQERNIGQALRRLRAKLSISAVPRTNVISIAYSSSSPELSKRVVDTLVSLYLDKHVAAHGMMGQFEFFDQQVARYHKELQDAEAALATFSDGQGGAVSPAAQRDEILRQQHEFQATLAQTRSAIAETAERIRTLEKEANSTPARVTTELKSADNPQLIQNMKSTLLTLQLKRTELLTKYQASYPLVQEVDREIAHTQAAIASAVASPLKDQTTNLNPTYQWVDAELAKAKTELRSLESRERETSRTVDAYDSNAHKLDRQSLHYQDLARTAKASEENYLLYEKKREEARISSALNERRLLNVSLVQPATLPYFPKHSALFYLLASILAALLLSGGLLFALDRLENTFHHPRELERFTAMPVLTAIPVEFPPAHLERG